MAWGRQVGEYQRINVYAWFVIENLYSDIWQQVWCTCNDICYIFFTQNY